MESQSFTSVQKKGAIANVEMIRKRRRRINEVLVQIYAEVTESHLVGRGMCRAYEMP